MQYTYLGTKGTGHGDTGEKTCFKATLLFLQQSLDETYCTELFYVEKIHCNF